MRFLDGRTRASWCHREAGRVQDGLALRFLVGIGTDPLRRDTDLDVLGDPVLAPDYDRDVCDGGNDRPGFGPNHRPRPHVRHRAPAALPRRVRRGEDRLPALFNVFNA